MSTPDFCRDLLDAMTDLRHPLAVVPATRMPWAGIERSLAPLFARKARMGSMKPEADMFGPTAVVGAGGPSAAGRPRLPIRLMAVLLHLKRAFNERKESVVERWSKNCGWPFFSSQQHYEPRLPCDPSRIGRFRQDHGMQRCWRKGSVGDALQTVLCAAGYDLRWLLRAMWAAWVASCPRSAVPGPGLSLRQAAVGRNLRCALVKGGSIK
ncbi:MAG: transposase [Burkholderiaceae bacterium]